MTAPGAHTDEFSEELLLALDTWASMTTDETITWLSRHSIDTQLVGGQVQAKDVWMMKNGTVCDEWIIVTCDLRWLRNWMNY